jgi:hypothetical protein
MTVILVAISTVLSLYIFEPLWFDTRMHYYHNTYQSDKACSLAANQQKDVTGRVCVPKNDYSGNVDLYLTKE